MNGYLWEINIDQFVADLKDAPTFSATYQDYLKSAFKQCAFNLQKKFKQKQSNVAMIDDIIAAEKKLNLILFSFAYDYDISEDGLEFVLARDGAQMYWQGMTSDNFPFEKNTFLGKC